MSLLDKKAENLLLLSWGVALIATLGSLYYSEIVGYIPCTYCWYQRIIMYPLVIVLGVAIFQKNTKIWLTVLCFSIPGTLLAAFHYALQKLPALQSSVAECTSEVPCTAQYVNYFGFITIPFLSLIAFLIITLLSFLLMKRSKEIQS